MKGGDGLKDEKEMLEKDIEKYLVRRCRENGYLCFKFTSPAHAGVPDRILIGNGRVIFVELKRPGAKPRELQIRTFRHMRDGGADVRVIDTRKLCDDLISEVRDGKNKSVGAGWDM